ncbi:response regulator transcription factor [Cytobacillus purgationiresistens]|uniref:DNA-binding response OmpR family regulator n=1 Tax=Cytobacillus purgationiresistens TaxID=863449 RepID=A0ABU0ASD8_9BACI|nr:response regulator transcription factor [Cytobacillus purgationiresistens]MDQ0273712.1 DNA-binding response OmpR family regulator [Cytobacillus purgationiresistens]
MTKISVLIIDDEADMRHLTQMYLENSGFLCYTAGSGKEGYQLIKEKDVDLVILDIMMPDEDGYVVCKNIREHSDIPIIFLSAKGEEWDKVKGLQLGGDDYIVKPLSPGELVARIHAVLRRTGISMQEAEQVKIAQLSVDKKARKVTVEGNKIPLTLKEFEMLLFLINHRNQALSREQLLEHVWGLEYEGSLRTVDTHIKTLRMKLGMADYIQTVWGVGYKFEVPDQ